MPDIKNVFADVADALGIGATSIVEKDYYVVELLRLLQSLEFETHDLVFAGGTSLAKANIQLNRMSEDVDIKIVPKPNIALSRSKAKVVRKQLLHQVQDKISQSDFFTIEEEPVVCSVTVLVPAATFEPSNEPVMASLGKGALKPCSVLYPKEALS